MFVYEDYESGNSTLKLDIETIGLRGSVGSAIPLRRSLDGDFTTGVAPEVGVNTGTFSVDADSSGLRSDDDSSC